MLRFLFTLGRCCVVFRCGTLLEMLSLFYDIAQKLEQNSSPITVPQCNANQHWHSLWRKQYKNRQWQEPQYPAVAPRVRQTFILFSDLTSSWYQSLISLRSVQWDRPLTKRLLGNRFQGISTGLTIFAIAESPMLLWLTKSFFWTKDKSINSKKISYAMTQTTR